VKQGANEITGSEQVYGFCTPYSRSPDLFQVPYAQHNTTNKNLFQFLGSTGSYIMWIPNFLTYRFLIIRRHFTVLHMKTALHILPIATASLQKTYVVMF
jgi:hypothetical protein